MFNIIRHNRDFFNSFFDDFDLRPTTSNLLTTDIVKEDGKHIITIEMPGYEKDDIKISVNNGYLNIEAVRNYEKNNEDEKVQYVRRERYYGTVKRSYYIGNVELKSINGTYKDGILKLEVPEETKVISEYLELK